MDEVEKIKDYAAKWFCKGRECGKVPITKDMFIELEKEGEELLSDLGYPKPHGKPPLLSDEELYHICGLTEVEGLDIERQIAQAQREADIKHYEGS